jgi:molybdenum cofactor biosynthesis enzyme MoaA
LYCPYIEKGLTIENDGMMVPCCVFNDDLNFNIRKNTIKEYFASDQYQQLNQQFEQGIWPKGCASCEIAEKNKQLSLRQNTLSQKDLYSKQFIDLTIGNECNSDCVMCVPENSSKILSRIRKHGAPEDVEYTLDFDKNDWINDDSLWQSLEDDIQNIGCLKFLGGEPFLNKNIWKQLNRPGIQKHKADINLMVTTNASILPSEKMEELQGWKSLLINASIDASGKQFEWIRQGLDWQTVSSNVQKINSLQNSIVSVSLVVSVYSIANVHHMLEWVNRNDCLVYFNMLEKPPVMSINRAPVEILEQTLSRLKGLKMIKVQNQIQLASLKHFIKKSIAENQYDSTVLNRMTDYYNRHRTHNMNTTTLEVE